MKHFSVLSKKSALSILEHIYLLIFFNLGFFVGVSFSSSILTVTRKPVSSEAEFAVCKRLCHQFL